MGPFSFVGAISRCLWHYEAFRSVMSNRTFQDGELLASLQKLFEQLSSNRAIVQEEVITQVLDVSFGVRASVRDTEGEQNSVLFLKKIMLPIKKEEDFELNQLFFTVKCNCEPNIQTILSPRHEELVELSTLLLNVSPSLSSCSTCGLQGVDGEYPLFLIFFLDREAYATSRVSASPRITVKTNMGHIVYVLKSVLVRLESTIYSDLYVSATNEWVHCCDERTETRDERESRNRGGFLYFYEALERQPLSRTSSLAEKPAFLLSGSPSTTRKPNEAQWTIGGARSPSITLSSSTTSMPTLEKSPSANAYALDRSSSSLPLQNSSSFNSVASSTQSIGDDETVLYIISLAEEQGHLNQDLSDELMDAVLTDHKAKKNLAYFVASNGGKSCNPLLFANEAKFIFSFAKMIDDLESKGKITVVESSKVRDIMEENTPARTTIAKLYHSISGMEDIFVRRLKKALE
eukprot:TRINITY_DN2792_c0_g1_i2.p1 TRINITY_DN2792_c0_g1~~TRINITY_DN2792_c0_g1_i2.p1  ORF type:complete len:462 (-),score=123.00 TRINITY_DN2792_c0_g1_i2:47-1432(-)